jgi:hypothetical protein
MIKSVYLHIYGSSSQLVSELFSTMMKKRDLCIGQVSVSTLHDKPYNRFDTGMSSILNTNHDRISAVVKDETDIIDVIALRPTGAPE